MVTNMDLNFLKGDEYSPEPTTCFPNYCFICYLMFSRDCYVSTPPPLSLFFSLPSHFPSFRLLNQGQQRRLHKCAPLQ